MKLTSDEAALSAVTAAAASATNACRFPRYAQRASFAARTHVYSNRSHAQRRIWLQLQVDFLVTGMPAELRGGWWVLCRQ